MIRYMETCAVSLKNGPFFFLVHAKKMLHLSKRKAIFSIKICLIFRCLNSKIIFGNLFLSPININKLLLFLFFIYLYLMTYHFTYSCLTIKIIINCLCVNTKPNFYFMVLSNVFLFSEVKKCRLLLKIATD